MRLRHGLASLALVGSLACGTAATVTVLTGDPVSSATATGNTPATYRPAHLDERVSNQIDDNGDDTGAVSLAGLEVEIEVPENRVTSLGPGAKAPAAMT